MRADGVVVPAELCRPLARLAVLGLAELTRRDGDVRPAAGVLALLTELAEVGHAVPSVESRAVRQLASGQAAAVIGCSPRSARRMAASGKLRASRPGHEWLIDQESAEDLARRRSAAA